MHETSNFLNAAATLTDEFIRLAAELSKGNDVSAEMAANELSAKDAAEQIKQAVDDSM